MRAASKFREYIRLREEKLNMNIKRFSIIPLTMGLVFVLLFHFPLLMPLSAAALPSPPVNITEWQLYEPVAEVVLPTGDANVPRAVEEKDGYVYLLAREGILYTYDISDLPLQQSFVTYNTPVYKQTLYSGNGNGLLRYGNYLYVFGRNGLETVDVQNPGMPALLGLRNDLNIYNMVRYENYLIAAGWQRIVVYSIDEPSNPTLLSDLYMGEEQLVWSAAVYGSTLYACNWTSDWQGSYTNYLSIIDFSNPASLSVLNTISRDDQAYHLRVIGNQLVECTSGQASLWDLTTPANPVFLASQQAGGRVAALDGDNIVTNGTVLRPNGNDLQVVATFTPGGSQQDGYPHGSAVNASFVFIAQSARILILNASMPPLSINHASGGPGSFFTITGHGFPPNSTATIVVNSYTLGDVVTDAAGDCIFLLDTEQAEEGRYVVAATLDPSASTSFVIASGEPVHPHEGGGTIFQIPSGIAYGKYGGGNGMPEDPYQIWTPDQMNAVGAEPNDWSGHFKLMADIDLSDFDGEDGRITFNIIAPDTDLANLGHQGSYFTGVFDGNFHTISNFSYTFSGSVYNSSTGIFGMVRGPNALIKNLGLINPSIHTDGAHVGSIAASLLAGTISNCYAEGGSVSGTSGVGGLVGDNSGTIISCHSSVNVSGTSDIGGLVGFNMFGANIINCSSTGDILGACYVGGIAARNNRSNVISSFSTGTISCNRVCGGLIGGNENGYVSNCYSRSDVSVECDIVGGLIGYNFYSDVINCYSVGTVMGMSNVGGLIGWNDSYKSLNSFWDTETSGQDRMCGSTDIKSVNCDDTYGKTTAQMQMQSTFTDAAWDFVDETDNGEEDIWWIDEGADYPRLWWELLE